MATERKKQQDRERMQRKRKQQDEELSQLRENAQILQKEIMPWISRLEASLVAIMVGGCTCHTKSPDLHMHELYCHYLNASNALGMVDEIKDLLPPPATSANDMPEASE